MYSKTLLVLTVAAIRLAAADPVLVGQSDRRIPIGYSVDVVVAGGSTGAVAAAVAAAARGAKVFLLAPRPYLGEDMCATMRLWLEEGEEAVAPLAKRLFKGRGPFRPMHIKKTLDDALLEAGVQFLYGSFATGVLRDDRGRVSGVVMANRAGRQAVIAKTVVDATPRATVARIAGAAFRPYPAGPQTFKRVVIGGELKSGKSLSVRKTGLAFRGDGSAGTESNAAAPAAEILEYTLQIPMTDGSFVSFARAEQLARDLTSSEFEKVNTEELFQVPPDPMKGVRQIAGPWKGAGHLDLGAFRPAGIDSLFVLSGAADMPRAHAERLLRPAALIEIGARIGQAAAEEAARRPEPRGVAERGGRRAPVTGGDIKETLAGVRPALRDVSSVPSLNQSVPVLGSYDVVVAGAGTAGSPATIAAARTKARTLAIEYLHGMGGVGTMGMIPGYWWGQRIGFSREVPGTFREVRLVNPPFGWRALDKAEWLRRTAREAGAEVWFGAVACGAYVDNGRVKGVVVATPEGRGVVLAKTVIDATGNADVAAPAGAQTVVTGSNEIAQYATGLPRVNLGGGGMNTGFTITDETDVVDIWHLLVYAKDKYIPEFDFGQLVDSRERRRIVADFELSIRDIVSGRTFPDTIALGYSHFDADGNTIDPLLLLTYPESTEGIDAKLPYRCLVPKGLEGILVAGLAMGVHRDTLAVLRMQADIENHGYAAGVAAALASQSGSVRSVDVRALQRRLIARGVLPQSVLTEKDSFPLSEADVARAVAEPGKFRNQAILLSRPEVSTPLLREAYRKETVPTRKLAYAMTLAVLGDALGLPTLTTEFYAQGGAQGRDLKPHGETRQASALDNLLVAMARTRDRRALEPALKRAALLDAKSGFPHHRAVTLAFEMVGDSKAAAALAELLSKPGMTGYAVTKLEDARRLSAKGADPRDRNPPLLSLRELGLARALWRLGDRDGLAKRILTEYSKDLRGHFARHARAVLDETK